VVGSHASARVGVYSRGLTSQRVGSCGRPSDRPGPRVLHVTIAALLKPRAWMRRLCGLSAVGSNAEIYRDVKPARSMPTLDVSNLAEPNGRDCTCCSTGRCGASSPTIPISCLCLRSSHPEKRDGLVRTWRLTERCSGSCPPPTSCRRIWRPAAPCCKRAAPARAAGLHPVNAALRRKSGNDQRSASTYLQALHVSLGLQKSFCRSNDR